MWIFSINIVTCIFILHIFQLTKCGGKFLFPQKSRHQKNQGLSPDSIQTVSASSPWVGHFSVPLLSRQREPQYVDFLLSLTPAMCEGQLYLKACFTLYESIQYQMIEYYTQKSMLVNFIVFCFYIKIQPINNFQGVEFCDSSKMISALCVPQYSPWQMFYILCVEESLALSVQDSESPPGQRSLNVESAFLGLVLPLPLFTNCVTFHNS